MTAGFCDACRLADNGRRYNWRSRLLGCRRHIGHDSTAPTHATTSRCSFADQSNLAPTLRLELNPIGHLTIGPHCSGVDMTQMATDLEIANLNGTSCTPDTLHMGSPITRRHSHACCRDYRATEIAGSDRVQVEAT
ncbi:hypothetical protein BO83DRAFT_134341 [Aspergillus eucalypticola CBS 122712]|uniref:Uncharacterized protein n=1 Tax=Aspergillus eucalypticola (strain CBS 122712 / IBT 29274) TaxID=1448314 RepID=A0A317WBJ2_ASPEC|nr:uncharacterized protein BO83DRAFT_134341 [Aspergillus eucalypticola CBS 122712]PWY82682.1 hypothetical protein BO83DRAFT_134341 [Aspergillus eucalypticola CBS 122712]